MTTEAIKDYRWDDRTIVKCSSNGDSGNIMWSVSISAADLTENGNNDSPMLTFSDHFASTPEGSEFVDKFVSDIEAVEDRLVKAVNSVIGGATDMGVTRLFKEDGVPSAKIVLWAENKDSDKDLPVAQRELLARVATKLGASLNFYYDLSGK